MAKTELRVKRFVYGDTARVKSNPQQKATQVIWSL